MAVEYITLTHITPTIPPTFGGLILTDNEEVFHYYQRNVELHKGKNELRVRQAQAKSQDHKNKKPDEILSNISQVAQQYKMKYEGVVYSVGPGVFPGNQFRCSKKLHDVARSVSGKRVLDYGCSNGFIGLAAREVEHVTFVDINPIVENYLHESIALNNYIDRSNVIIGNLPDLGRSVYDTIFFNPPFHLESTREGMGSSVKDDPSIRIIEHFWKYVRDYMHSKSSIYCAFSNKDPRALELLEQSIDSSGLYRKLIVHEYIGTNSDVRIYRVTAKKVPPFVVIGDKTYVKHSIA